MWTSFRRDKDKHFFTRYIIIIARITDQERPCMKPQGRVRGLIAVWKETQRGKIWAPMIRVPGQGRVATLALLKEMAVHNAMGIPGPRQQRGRGRGLTYYYHDDQPATSMGKARVRNLSTCPPPEPPLHLPYTWSQCLCRCRHDLPALPSPPCAESAPPRPSSAGSDMDSTSGPPSLETVTGPDSPESGYEASNSASISD